MKIIRIIFLIALILTTFVSMDLLFNLLGSLITSMNDGIGIHGILAGRLFFGDTAWSQERFFDAFVISSLVSFAVFTVNVVLMIVDILKKRYM